MANRSSIGAVRRERWSAETWAAGRLGVLGRVSRKSETHCVRRGAARGKCANPGPTTFLAANLTMILALGVRYFQRHFPNPTDSRPKSPPCPVPALGRPLCLSDPLEPPTTPRRPSPRPRLPYWKAPVREPPVPRPRPAAAARYYGTPRRH